MVNNDIAALAVLNPEKAVEVAQMLMIDTLAEQVLDIANDPSQVDAETFNLATSDSLNMALNTLKSLSGTPRHAAQTLIDILENLTPGQVNELSGMIQRALIAVRQSGGNFDTAMAAQFKTTSMSTATRQLLSDLVTEGQKIGVWGSIAGAASAASFIYKANNGAFSPDSTPMERWGLARDLLGFLSVGTHMGKFIVALATPTGYSGAINDLFGLNKTLPQVWGQSGLSDPATNAIIKDEAFNKAFANSVGEIFNDWDSMASQSLADAPSSVDPTSSYHNQLLSESAENGTTILGKDVNAITARRIGQSVYKFLSNATDIASGIGDAIVGGIGAHKAVAAGDTTMAVINSVQAVSGIAVTVAGGLGTWGAMTGATVGTTTVLAAAAPLFLAANILGLAALIATFSVMAKRINEQHAKLVDHTQEQRTWFENLDKLGVLEDDWEDKLDYANMAMSIYGNDNTNANSSYWDVNHEEFEHFKSTPEYVPGDKYFKAPIGLNRLDYSLHVKSDKTHENARNVLYFYNEKYDDTPTNPFNGTPIGGE